MFCKECGHELKEGDSFCPQCGTEVKQKSEKSQSADSSKRLKISLVIGCVVGAIVVVLIILAVVKPPIDFLKDTPFSSVKTQEAVVEKSDENKAENSKSEKQEQPKEEATSQSKYILENSATKELTNADIEGLSDDEICIAQNEIWARHGRKFKNNWLQEHFNNQSWYSGTIEADDFLSQYSATDMENSNAQFLNSVLSSRGYDLNKAHPNDEQTSSAASNSNVATLTQQLKDEGFDTVVQGEVRKHVDKYDNGPHVTYYVRLTQPADITGYKASDYKTVSTQTLYPSYGYKGKFSKEEESVAYMSQFEGHQVLVGFNNGAEDVGIASGVTCNYGYHTLSECDMMNSGEVTFVRNYDVIDLG